MSVLTQIQQEIEAVYALPHLGFVEDFLIDQATVRAHVTTEDPLREVLLCNNDTGHPQIGLYIPPPYLKLLESDSPWNRLTNRNLDPFCTAIEGVSHFLLLFARILCARPVTQLELELQAEVDKFLLCLFALERQREPVAQNMLRQTLFHGYRLLAGLPDGEAERYHLANRLAFQFSTKLQRIAHPLNRTKLISAARRFQQTNLQGKIHLAQLSDTPELS